MPKGLYPIVGSRHRGPEAERIIRTLARDEALVLERDPQNPYDPNAVKVIARGEHVGFVPKALAALLAKEMDAADMPQLSAKFAFDSARAPCAVIEEPTATEKTP
ncbi:MAG: HIRAN domain-containing protein [Patescibacteria group bacterium]|nr:HIRAN domain-containing protein [Patescibacteria group bacterium]